MAKAASSLIKISFGKKKKEYHNQKQKNIQQKVGLQEDVQILNQEEKKEIFNIYSRIKQYNDNTRII